MNKYEIVKEQLVFRMVSLKNIPENVPFKVVCGDMAVTCSIEVAQTEEQSTNILITYDVMKKLGVTKEQLFHDAALYAPKNRPASLRDLGSVMCEIIGEGFIVPDSPLMVACVKGSVHGAAAICYPGFLEKIYDKVGSFFIIPSSVHELLIIQDEYAPCVSELNSMIQSINRTEVMPHERLSDIAYHYDGVSIETAVEYERRIRRSA